MNKQRGPASGGLFVTDLDGTLLGPNGEAAQTDLEALATLNRLGVWTAIATGRSLYSFINSAGAGLPVDFVIFTTGAGVVTQTRHELLYHVNLPAGMVAQSLAFMQNTALDFMLHHPVPDNHRFVYRRANPDNADFERRLERYRPFGQSLENADLDGFGAAAQILAVVPPAKAKAALQELGSGLPGLSIVHSTSPLDHASTWVELFHPNVSKGKTAAWLAAELGVKHGRTIAVGNDFNDLDLLEWAHRGYVVANAPTGLKNRFRQVASHREGGVAEAVSLWLDGQVL